MPYLFIYLFIDEYLYIYHLLTNIYNYTVITVCPVLKKKRFKTVENR